MIKSKIGNGVAMGQLLEFEVAFPDENPLSPEEYLKGGRRDIILKVASFFLGFKSYNSKYNENNELLGAIFGEENNQFANEVYEKIRNVEQAGNKVGIITAYTSLRLFECYFAKGEQEETQSRAEFERNLFKAYLVFNSKFISSQKAAFSSTEELPDDLKFPMMMFCMHYPIADKEDYDIKQIWATQMIKAIYLFEFLECQEKTKALIAAFLGYFRSATWQEYLKNLLPLTLSAIKNENEGHTDISVTPGDKFEESCSFIEKFIVEDTDELDENDFLTIRAKPFYKVNDGDYRIIFNLFVVEKIFKGVYFSLRDINSKLPIGAKVGEWRSYYGDFFSEKILLYKVIESIYSDNCIRFSGKEVDDMKIDGAPDYYVRKNKHILLFESKDFLIKAEHKASFDFNVYENEFERVLYYEELPDGKIKNKAVMQLINTISKLLRKTFSPDTDYNIKDIFIYPVLVTHDHQYDVPGFNYLLNSWFQEELEELKSQGLFIYHVKPLVVINIDALIYNQVGLGKNIRLHEVLKLYEEHNKKVPRFSKIYSKFRTVDDHKQDAMNKLIPFSLFIEKIFIQNGIHCPPPMLDLVEPALFG